MRRKGLLSLFFLSGFAGLTYQVLWLRRLSLIFGVTVYAASTVLAAFMAGLAIGSLLAGRVIRRGNGTVVAFGIAEILVGLTGVLSPFLLDATSAIYVGLHHLVPESLTLLTLARLVCSFVILAIPTMMMGLTLPLLTAAIATQGGTVGERVGLLYAINTGGAVAGALATGFLLIPAIGIQASFFLAAAINIAVGSVAIYVTRRNGEASAAPSRVEVSSRSAPPMTSSEVRRIGGVVALSGLAALGLEVVWFRLLLQFFDATTHAFTVMLAVVLAGIAIGGGIGARLLKQDRRWPFWLSLIQAATGITVIASMTLLTRLVQAQQLIEMVPLVILAILPSAILMGVSFPIALGMVTGNEQQPGGGRSVGELYATNVIGAIIGSLATGFLLLPALGSRRSLVVLAALYLVSAVLVPRRERGWVRAAWVLVAMVGFAALARAMPDPIRVALAERHGTDLLEQWRDEGVQTVVSVRGSEYQHELYLNGLHQANDHPEMVKVHQAIGDLPMVLHGAAVDVLVVGLGGGATPGATSQYPGARVQVVELADGVRRAAPFFRRVNFDLVSLPNVDIRIDDGRNFLQLTDRRFDVITADLIQPGHAGAGNLYSREYFSLVRHALRDDGVVLQWIGRRPPVEYGLIMRTFLEVFPDATLWYGGEFMVGTKRPLQIDPARFERLRTFPATREAMDNVGLTSFADLRRWYTAGPAEMRAFIGPGDVLTDDRPLVEYGWVPAAQPQLDLSSLKGDVNAVLARVAP